MLANGSGSWSTGVRSLSGWVRSTTRDGARRQGVDEVGERGHAVRSSSVSVRNASSSQSPQIVGIDLRVEHERAGRARRATRAAAARSSSERAVRPRQPAASRERGEVGVGELREVDGLAHRAEVVDLGAVGGVVVDDDEQRQAEAPERLELGQRQQRAAVAERGHRRGGRAARSPRRSRCRAPRPTHWKACGKTKPARVGHAQVHRRPAHEVRRSRRRPCARRAAGRRARC